MWGYGNFYLLVDGLQVDAGFYMGFKDLLECPVDAITIFVGMGLNFKNLHFLFQ
ncbi:hypothetical protein [Helcococcus kunzii]|uniref:hypothetical protein n=1 Tax=Helcococcus kunzii TaxID=40091 RepID=UPI0038A7E2EE